MGRGRSGFDECCALCSGLGFMVIDLTPNRVEVFAA